jgi:prophage regulatory protein
MTQLKLPRQASRRASDLTISLAGDLRTALEKYADLYRATYGEEITLIELIPAILAEFLADDGAFAPEFGSRAAFTPATLRAIEIGHPAAASAEKLIPLKEVCRLVGVGKSMVYRMVKQNRFPAPYKPSPGAGRWSEKEILAWISEIRANKR